MRERTRTNRGAPSSGASGWPNSHYTQAVSLEGFLREPQGWRTKG